MAKIDFPNPAEENPFIDPVTGQVWGYDGDGWIAQNTSTGGGILPPGGNDKDVLTKSGTADGVAVWANLDAGQF